MEDTHPTIVSKDIYQGVQEEMAKRGSKIMWRCATRIEKDKADCNDSVTVNEEKLKVLLIDIVCRGGNYNEEVVNERISCLKVFANKTEIFDKDVNVV